MSHSKTESVSISSSPASSTAIFSEESSSRASDTSLILPTPELRTPVTISYPEPVANSITMTQTDAYALLYSPFIDDNSLYSSLPDDKASSHKADGNLALF